MGDRWMCAALLAAACTGELGSSDGVARRDASIADATVPSSDLGPAERDATAPSPDASPAADAFVSAVDAASGPVAVTLSLVVTSRWLGERTQVEVDARRPDGSAAAGTLTLSFGDGTTETVAPFDGAVTRRHRFASEGEYTVEASLAGPRLEPTTARLPILIAAPRPVGDSTDHLDLSSVVWIDPDISGWDQTATIESFRIEEQQICGTHTQMCGGWPEVGDPPIIGNPWVFGFVDGQWYAATYEWMRPCQECKRMGSPEDGATVRERIGPHIKREPLESWRPRRGEIVGFMYSGWARFSMFDPASVRERSNVVLVEWPF